MWILNDHAAGGMRASRLAKAIQPREVLAVVRVACLNLKIDINGQANILPMPGAMEQLIGDIARRHTMLDACQRVIERTLDASGAIGRAVVAEQRRKPRGGNARIILSAIATLRLRVCD